MQKGEQPISFENSSSMYSLSTFFSLVICIVTIHNGRAIYRGKLAEPGELPYMAALAKRFCVFCGGAIISERHILTAAHCLDCHTKDSFLVYVDAIFISEESNGHEVAKIESPREYVPGRDASSASCMRALCSCVLGPPEFKEPQHDIAVLTLVRPLNLGGNVACVKLPTSDLSYSRCPCDFAGWGDSEHTMNIRISNPFLYSIQLVVEKPEVCEEFGEPTGDNIFCARDLSERCCLLKGDSGGPLVCANSVHGINSNGPCDPEYPTTFTKVFSYLDFIKGETGENPCP